MRLFSFYIFLILFAAPAWLSHSALADWKLTQVVTKKSPEKSRSLSVTYVKGKKIKSKSGKGEALNLLVSDENQHVCFVHEGKNKCLASPHGLAPDAVIPILKAGMTPELMTASVKSLSKKPKTFKGQRCNFYDVSYKLRGNGKSKLPGLAALTVEYRGKGCFTLGVGQMERIKFLLGQIREKPEKFAATIRSGFHKRIAIGMMLEGTEVVLVKALGGSSAVNALNGKSIRSYRVKKLEELSLPDEQLGLPEGFELAEEQVASKEAPKEPKKNTCNCDEIEKEAHRYSKRKIVGKRDRCPCMCYCMDIVDNPKEVEYLRSRYYCDPCSTYSVPIDSAPLGDPDAKEPKAGAER